jgi:hypothetical protein
VFVNSEDSSPAACPTAPSPPARRSTYTSIPVPSLACPCRPSRSPGSGRLSSPVATRSTRGSARTRVYHDLNDTGW